MGERTPESEALYREAYDVGRREGYLEGHRAGFFEGHRAGWEQGLRDASASAGRLSARPGPAALTVPGPAASTVPGPAASTVPGPMPAQGPVAPPQRVSPSGAVVVSARPAPAPPVIATAPPMLRSASVRATEAELDRSRRRRGIQNANIALYAASMLIVAAAALFLASAVAEPVRLGGLAAITVLFYGAGLAVQARVPRLRPAAVAFTGTGLALLPVAGLAFDVILVHRPAVTWLVTSVIGLVAFGTAAVRLESRILVYLSLTFAFSAAWSGASALGGALAAYFAAILLVSALLGFVMLLRPRWIPPIMLRPTARLHPYIAPATFCAATLAAANLGRWQYPSLVGAMCAYFVVAAGVRGPLAVRRASWWAARTTAVVAVGTTFSQAAGAGMISTTTTSAFEAGLVAASATAAAQIVVVGLLQQRIAASLRLTASGLLAEQAVAVGAQFALAVVLLGEGSLRGRLDAGTVFAVLVLLVFSAQFVAWWHGRVGEFAAVAAFGFVVLVRDAVTSGPFATLMVWGMVFWLARAAWPGRPPARRGWTRNQHVAAARFGSLAAAPAVVDVVLPASVVGEDRLAVLGGAVAVTACLQLVVTGVLGWLAREEFARGAMASTMTTASVLGSLVVGMSRHESARALHAVVVAAASLSAVIVLACLFPKAELRNPSAQVNPGVGELVPPVLLIGVAGGAFAADRWAAGDATLAVLCGVLAACALGSAPLARRWVYVWSARVVATGLVLALFHTLERDHWVLSVLGQPLAVWHVLAAAVLVQLTIPLAAESRGLRRRTPFPWGVEDAATLLVLAASSTAALVPARDYAAPGAEALGSAGPGPATAALVVAIAAGSALTGVVLRRRPASLVAAPFGLVASAVLAGGSLRLLEILAGLFAVYAAVMVYLAAGRAAKGAHLVAARALPLALAGLVAHDATASPTVVSLVLALGLAAQHVVRRMLRRATANLPFLGAAYWSGIAAQLALPVVYAASGRADGAGGRWLLVLESLLALVSVLATVREHPRAGYAGLLAALLALVWCGPAISFPPGQPLSAPILSGAALALVFALVAALHLVGRLRWERRQVSRRWPWTAGAGAFALASAVTGLGEAPWVFGVGLGACAAALIVASWTWARVPGVVGATFPLGVLAAIGAGIWVGRSVFASEVMGWGEAMPVLVGGLLPAGTGIALRWAVVWARDDAARLAPLVRLAEEPIRHWTLVAAGAFALVLAAVVSWEPPVVVVLPGLVAALVALTVSELAPGRRRLGAELGSVVVVAALQRAVFAGQEDVSLFWLAQWYVVLGAVIALLRYYGGKRRFGRWWLAASAALASFTGLLAAFSADTPQQIWLLVAFALLTAGGLVTGDRRFTVWGAVGVLACVLWAVRAYPYVLLAVLGLALIGATVWWLVRSPRGTMLP